MLNIETLDADNYCKFGVNKVNQIVNKVDHDCLVNSTVFTLFSYFGFFVQVVDGEMYPPTVSDVPVHMVYPKGFPPERQLAIGQELFGIVPGLTMYATLWLREHNRVCDILKAEHPTWDDEQLFQTTRLIIIGESQASAMLHCCSPAHMLWLLYFYLFTIYQAHYCVLQQSQTGNDNNFLLPLVQPYFFQRQIAIQHS